MTTPTLRLANTRYSPWSERARWVLDHHRLPYQSLDHLPFVGERRLRRLAGVGQRHDDKNKRVTVPLLLVGDQPITESWEIAKYADREGKGAALIPAERESEIRRWNDLADAAMSAGRGLIAGAILASPAALDETLPRGIPRALKPLLRPVTRYGMRWFARKYDVQMHDQAPRELLIRSTLAALREALGTEANAGEGPYLVGSFSYADIVMALCLQGISPVDDRYIRLGPATRAAWTRADLSREFSDLIAWRDRLYQRYRSPK